MRSLTRPVRRLFGSLHRERGSVSLETVILAPFLIGMLLLVIAAGRIGKANTTVDAAAYAAARAASISRSGAQAHTAAAAAATDSLTQQGLTCAGLQVSVDTSQFAVRAGQPAAVTADIACTVPLADLALPGLGGAKTLRGRAVSSIDTYRQRTP